MAKDEPKTGQTKEPAIVVARYSDATPYHPPTRSFEGDAGLDLYITGHLVVYPRQRVRIPHNVIIVPPPKHYGLIVPRSSTLSNLGLIVMPGVIDQGFRGEVQTVVFNPKMEAVMLNEGMRVSQLLILRQFQFEVEELPKAELMKQFPSTRGEKGFGSSNPPDPRRK